MARPGVEAAPARAGARRPVHVRAARRWRRGSSCAPTSPSFCRRRIRPSRSCSICRKRIGGTVDPADRHRERPIATPNLRLAGAITAKLRALPPDTIESAVYDVRAERQFFLARKWLYAPLDDLEALRDALRAEIDKQEEPALRRPRSTRIRPSRSSSACATRADAFDPFPDRLLRGRPTGASWSSSAGRRAGCSPSAPARSWPTRPTRIIADAHARDATTRSMQVGPHRRRHVAARGARTRSRATSSWPRAVCVTLVCLVVIVFYGRLARHAVRRHPGAHGRGVRLRHGRAALRLPERVDGVHGLDRRRQRHQLPDHPAGALRRGAARRSAGARGRVESRCRRTIRPTAVAALGAAVAYALADGDALPRLLAVRHHRRRSAWWRPGWRR